MKTRLLTILLLAAVVGIASCQTGRPTPPPTGPDPGSGTTAPPNPNPAPPEPPPPAATPVASANSGSALAEAVPDQPAVTASAARPHHDLVRLKNAGASEEALLEKVRTDGVNYGLTTADVLELRAAGFSETVLQAMLRSGQPSASR